MRVLQFLSTFKDYSNFCYAYSKITDEERNSILTAPDWCNDLLFDVTIRYFHSESELNSFLSEHSSYKRCFKDELWNCEIVNIPASGANYFECLLV